MKNEKEKKLQNGKERGTIEQWGMNEWMKTAKGTNLSLWVPLALAATDIILWFWLCHRYLVKPYRVGEQMGRAVEEFPGNWGVWFWQKEENAKCAEKQYSSEIWILKAVAPNRMFQHITSWAYNLLHSATVFVNFECWYESHILSISDCRAPFNIHLWSNTIER